MTAPVHRSLIGRVVSAVQAKARAERKRSRLAAFAAQAREHVVTVAALAAGVEGAFHWGPGVGWLSVMTALFVADFAVTGR